MKLALSFVALALSLSSFAAAEPADPNVVTIGPLRPLVNSELLQALLVKPTLLGHAHQLERFAKLSNGTRAFALLDATGYYDTSLQTFPYLYSEVTAKLSVDTVDLPTSAFTYGPGGVVTAQLVPVANLGCTPADFPADVVGKIAYIKRGECEFGLKVAHAGAAGAKGAVIYNNIDGSLSGTLSQPSRPEGPYVPIGGLPGAEGAALATRLANGENLNVIATTKSGDKNNIVFAGAHSDSVAAGPGINDDGSGTIALLILPLPSLLATIALLDIALRLPLFKVNQAVRFGWWTAEEFGLVGSEYHVANLSEEERSKIALYLNFDMLASGNSGYFVMDGNGDTHGTGLKTADAPFNGRSDYGPFIEVGIPSGGVLTGAEVIKTAEQAEWWGGEAGKAFDPCYHAKCDTIDNLRTDVWLNNVKAAAHGIATYARSIDGIPRTRSTSARTSGIRVSSMDYEERRHYTCGHDISVL
ncbi:hypothetical protein BKA70DRAFT_1502453 [Coprinopsis sp. MPI-PUGE-AT-0042]|nr:hypothetical protein BKA70DRAFT_1502453 [Coprinopsis sp. MPI-PUGE-AT-0042]